MANKFNVGDKVIIKSMSDILGMYEGDEFEKVSKNLEYFSDYFNKVGTIRSFFGVVCMVDCGPNCEILIPSDWLEKYDFFNNNKRIINVCEKWDSQKFKKCDNPDDGKEVDSEKSKISKELKLLESSNEMYENTKKELESKRCCESDKKIDGRIEMINDAQKDVLKRYEKLIDKDKSCNFCFEEGRTDVADSTQSFDCTASTLDCTSSTLSDGILCGTNGIHEYFTENERLMCHNFLVELPERYCIPCFNIDEFSIDRENKTVSMTVYENEKGIIIRKLLSELRFGGSSGINTDYDDVSVYHYKKNGEIAYKEVFRRSKLENVVDDVLSYNGDDEFFAHHVTFRYNTDFIEDNDVVPANASFIIEKHKKLNNK